MKQKVYKELKGGDRVRLIGFSITGEPCDGTKGEYLGAQNDKGHTLCIVKLDREPSGGVRNLMRSQLINLKPRKKREVREFECGWEEIGNKLIYPSTYLTDIYPTLKQLTGKRTKVTVEVLGDE